MKDTMALDDALPDHPHLRRLNQREIEVMDYVVQGLSNKEIATAIGIAQPTVASHITNIRAKLQAMGKNRNALIAAYLTTRET